MDKKNLNSQKIFCLGSIFTYHSISMLFVQNSDQNFGRIIFHGKRCDLKTFEHRNLNDEHDPKRHLKMKTCSLLLAAQHFMFL